MTAAEKRHDPFDMPLFLEGRPAEGVIAVRVLARDPNGTWAGAATEYLNRGDPALCSVVTSGADVAVTADDEAGDVWRFTDRAGRPLTDSQWVRSAVAGRLDTVDIQLRNGATLLAQGRMDVRRTAAATAALALSVAGPLIEMAIARPEQVPAVDEEVPDPPGSLATGARSQWSFAGRLSRAAVTYRQWGIACLQRGTVTSLRNGAPLAGPLDWQSPPPNRFWADPTVVCDGDECWVFVEELDRATGKGHIRALKCRGSQLVPAGIVHTGTHHLSFPQIQRVAGRWLATVETCGATNPIMTFDRLGDQWRVARDLPALPPHLADPVVEFDAAGRPGRVLGTDARTSADAAFVVYRSDGDSDRGSDTAWRRVPGATYVDVRSARGGGTWDHSLGLRAVQDCARTYGRGVRLVPDRGWFGSIDRSAPVELDGESAPPGNWSPVGVHTLTWTADQEHVWLDGWRRHGSALGGYKRVVERRHLAQCTG